MKELWPLEYNKYIFYFMVKHCLDQLTGRIEFTYLLCECRLQTSQSGARSEWEDIANGGGHRSSTFHHI